MTGSFIKTSRGKFFYNPVPLMHGMGKIDKVIAFENLLTTKEIFDRNEIRFGLMFGTLLGAVRDGDFIDWDEDVDLYLLEEQRETLHDSLHSLRAEGLELVRSESDLYSIMRNGQYIDLYFFRTMGKKRRSLGYEVNASHLDVEEKMDFRGFEFGVPSNKEILLTTLYGSDWRTPQQNAHAAFNTRYQNFLRFLEAASPLVFSFGRHIKRKVMRLDVK